MWLCLPFAFYIRIYNSGMPFIIDYLAQIFLLPVLGGKIL